MSSTKKPGELTAPSVMYWKRTSTSSLPAKGVRSAVCWIH